MEISEIYKLYNPEIGEWVPGFVVSNTRKEISQWNKNRTLAGTPELWLLSRSEELLEKLENEQKGE